MDLFSCFTDDEIGCSSYLGSFRWQATLCRAEEFRAQIPPVNDLRWVCGTVTGLALCRSDLSCHNRLAYATGGGATISRRPCSQVITGSRHATMGPADIFARQLAGRATAALLCPDASLCKSAVPTAEGDHPGAWDRSVYLFRAPAPIGRRGSAAFAGRHRRAW